jgi:hypothetical protein
LMVSLFRLRPRKGSVLHVRDRWISSEYHAVPLPSVKNGIPMSFSHTDASRKHAVGNIHSNTRMRGRSLTLTRLSVC